MPLETVQLRDLAHFQLIGPDAERYLNGQVTQQVAGLALADTCYAFVCDAKGRILFDAHITRMDDGFLLNTSLSQRAEVLARLDRYLIADDCTWEDVTEDWTLIHQYDSDSAPQPGSVNRFGYSGRDQYYPLAEIERPPITKDLQSLETLRIENGIAKTCDLIGAFPAETGLEDRAVSFAKGCYLGQEVISRMKRAGRTNRQLRPATITGPEVILPAEFKAGDAAKAAFTLTSITEGGPGETRMGLGYLSTKADLSQELRAENGAVAHFPPQ